MSLRSILYRARWVLPVSAEPVAHGEVLVGADGLIAAVAPAGALEVGQDMEVRDFGNAILLPGLVNVHAHPELAMFRGALEDLLFRDWILRLVGAKRSVLTDDDSLAAARWTMVELARAGVTTVAATEMSGAGAVAMGEVGMRGILYQEVFGPDPQQVDESMRGLREAVDRLSAEASARVRIGISPHAPYTVSDPLYRAATGYALEAGLPMAVHIAESRAERELVVRGEGDFAPGLRARGIATPPRARSPIDLLRRLGVLEARPLLIHCVDLDAEDIDTIAGSGSAVAHCPVANARLGHGVAPLVGLREAGVAVGLGTDSVGSNNRLDLLEEARIGSILHRGRSGSAQLLPAEELLRLCTIDGARALGLDDRIGTLEPGKQADLCAVSLDSVHTVPAPDPASTLFHSARGTDVVFTAVGGETVFDGAGVRGVDAGAVRRAVEDAAGRLLEFRVT